MCLEDGPILDFITSPVAFVSHSSLSELTRVPLMRWMKANKRLIVLLFQGKEFSRRHNDFLSGIKKRGETLNNAHLALTNLH